MKKIYFLCGLAVLTFGVNAQSIDKSSFKKFRMPIAKNNKTIATGQNQLKAPGDLIYSNTFDVSGDWTLSAPNIQGEWEYVSTTPGDLTAYMGDNTSTTNADGFIAFNGVQFLLAGSVDAQDATAELNTAIDLSAYPAVSILFEQRYRAFNSDQTFLEVSGDNGATWTQIEINQAIPTNDPATQNQINLNVSPYIGGAAQAKIRFRWLEQSGDDGFGSGYGWMVDDLEIREAEGFDISLNTTSWYHNSTYKVEYSAIPVDQVAPMTFDGSIENVGASTMENTVLTADVTGAATGTASSTALDLSPLATVFVETATTVTPSTLGTYNVVYSASGDSIDVDLTNNTIAGSFEVTQFQYGKDDGAMTGSYGPFDDDADGIDDPYEILAEYEINATTSFTGVQVCLSTASTDGAEIYYNLYYDDGAGGWIPEYDGLSAPVPTYTVSAAEFTASGGAEWINLAFPSAISVDPAVAPAVYPVVGYSFDPVNYAVSGSAPDTSNYLTVFATTAGQSDYFITSKPMLRLSQDPNLSGGGGVGINNLDNTVELGQNVPNPTNGSTAIPFNLANTANVEFIVTDVMGKIVESRDLGTISSGTHSVNMSTINLAGGIYYYTLIADGKKSTKKMSVAK